MVGKAITTTRRGPVAQIEYARVADDLVILVEAHPRNAWLLRAAQRRLREELAKLRVEINEEKSRVVDLKKGESFAFLGFEYRYLPGRSGKMRVKFVPKLKKRTALFAKLREAIRRKESQPVREVIAEINPVLRGWVNYFRIGNSSHCFAMVKRWVERKIRRHMQRARQRPGMGWKRWSTRWIHGTLGLFNDYSLRRPPRRKAVAVPSAT